MPATLARSQSRRGLVQKSEWYQSRVFALDLYLFLIRDGQMKGRGETDRPCWKALVVRAVRRDSPIPGGANPGASARRNPVAPGHLPPGVSHEVQPGLKLWRRTQIAASFGDQRQVPRGIEREVEAGCAAGAHPEELCLSGWTLDRIKIATAEKPELGSANWIDAAVNHEPPPQTGC